MKLYPAFWTLACAIAGYAKADSPPAPNALRCEFTSYASAVAQQPDKDIKAEVRAEPGIDPLIFAALDPQGRSAQLIGNIGAAPVTMIATSTTWSFVEVTDAGNVTVTQVFLWNEPEAQSGRYRAIHSRQSSVMGAIAASQHYGHCKALN
jgi:hypothetical protein